MAHDYYVRTTSGEYRDDRHEFGPKWKGVPAGELRSNHFSDPQLEIVTAEEHAKASRKAAKEEESIAG